MASDLPVEEIVFSEHFSELVGLNLEAEVWSVMLCVSFFPVFSEKMFFLIAGYCECLYSVLERTCFFSVYLSVLCSVIRIFTCLYTCLTS